MVGRRGDMIMETSKRLNTQNFSIAFLGAFLGVWLGMSQPTFAQTETQSQTETGTETKTEIETQTGTEKKLTSKKIQFTFSGIKKAGDIYYSIYCDPTTYGKAGTPNIIGTVEGSFPVTANADVEQSIEISTTETHCALLFYVDENGNGVLDRSRFLGLPLEGVGFSRVTSKPYSKPSWDNTRFELASTDTMTAQAFYY